VVLVFFIILWAILFLAESRTISWALISKKDLVGNMHLWHSWNSQNISLHKKVCWPCEDSSLVLGHSVPHINFMFCRTIAFGISHYFISPVKEISGLCFCLCTANKWTKNLNVVTVRGPHLNLLTQFHFGILQGDSTGQYKAYFTLSQKVAALSTSLLLCPQLPIL
jgi:hypothetical protein